MGGDLKTTEGGECVQAVIEHSGDAPALRAAPPFCVARRAHPARSPRRCTPRYPAQPGVTATTKRRKCCQCPFRPIATRCRAALAPAPHRARGLAGIAQPSWRLGALESAVPCSAPTALRTCKPGRWLPAGRPARKSCLTPQSTTVGAMPFRRGEHADRRTTGQKVLHHLPAHVAREKPTRRVRSARGHRQTPPSGLGSSTGSCVPRIWPILSARSSMRPKEPSGLVCC